jgi:hypothetical protein
MIKSNHDNPEQAIQEGYRIALCNEPDRETIGILSDLYHNANTELSGELVSTGKYQEDKLDAMTVVANAIMNLDEFVTKE